MTEQITDHSGKLERPRISHFELIRICLNNAPEGVDKKQVAEVLRILEGTSTILSDDEDYDEEPLLLEEEEEDVLLKYLNNNPGTSASLEVVDGQMYVTVDHDVWERAKENN